MVTVYMRTYFSLYHLWAARRFAKLAEEIEIDQSKKPNFRIEHRVYVMNSVFSSFAFIEAAINEVFQDATDEHESYVGSLDKNTKLMMAGVWRATEANSKSWRALDKYQIALDFAEKPRFETGSSPYHEVNILRLLRNYFVHYKPETTTPSSPPKLALQLMGKFPANRLVSIPDQFPDSYLGCGCAEWAVNSSTKFTDSFFSKMGMVPPYQKTSFDKT